MKRIWTFLFILVTTRSYSQDEFASTAFYNDLKKLYADARQGFTRYKGEKRKGEFEELAAEYKVKLLLPLADSGKIVLPHTGNPYAVYFFEPDKNRLKLDQRAVSLRDAILVSYDQPLYARTETIMVNNHPVSNSWLFDKADESMSSEAVFRISIYYEKNKYFLSFEIRGKNPG